MAEPDKIADEVIHRGRFLTFAKTLARLGIRDPHQCEGMRSGPRNDG